MASCPTSQGLSGWIIPIGGTARLSQPPRFIKGLKSGLMVAAGESSWALLENPFYSSPLCSVFGQLGFAWWCIGCLWVTPQSGRTLISLLTDGYRILSPPRKSFREKVFWMTYVRRGAGETECGRDLVLTWPRWRAFVFSLIWSIPDSLPPSKRNIQKTLFN